MTDDVLGTCKSSDRHTVWAVSWRKGRTREMILKIICLNVNICSCAIKLVEKVWKKRREDKMKYNKTKCNHIELNWSIKRWWIIFGFFDRITKQQIKEDQHTEVLRVERGEKNNKTLHECVFFVSVRRCLVQLFSTCFFILILMKKREHKQTFSNPLLI